MAKPTWSCHAFYHQTAPSLYESRWGGRLLRDKEPSRFTGSLTENNGV